MRSFSLVGLLVTVCIGLLIFAKFEIPIAKESKPARNEAQQMSGHSETGEDASRSITYEPVLRGNDLKGLTVKTLEHGGAMEKYYGLIVGDEIVGIGELTMDTFNGDPNMAEAQVMQEGFEKKKPLTVVRGGETLVLPVPNGPHP